MCFDLDSNFVISQLYKTVTLIRCSFEVTVRYFSVLSSFNTS